MSSTYPEFKQLNLKAISDEMLAFWDASDAFRKSVDSRPEGKPFVFYEGPPSANGFPGIHHVMARAIKDIFCRFKTLEGYRVNRKAGWDTHGLPVELGVEKELGITKEDIGKKITIEEYNQACRSAVMRYTKEWNDLTRLMGYWVDMENPYVTYHNKYIESVWWLLGKLFNQNLLYKGYTIQPYSPAAGTGLSSHELNQPGCYREVKDTSVVAMFKVIDASRPQLESLTGSVEGDVHFLAWTTTPWTLPSNTALTVGPNITYALVHTLNPYTGIPIRVILAKDLIGYQFGSKYNQVNSVEETLQPTEDKKTNFYVAAEFKGSDLVGIRYEQLLPWTLPMENADQAFRVIPGDFVTTEDGTGIVHTAPTFGADDARVARENGVPPMLVADENGNPVPLVDLTGRFTSHCGPMAGKFVKNEYYPADQAPEMSADVEIAIHLKANNQAFKVEKYAHNYPHCWRTDKPVLYYPLNSWFIRATEKRDRMVELNKAIGWRPESTGTGRFGNWLENLNDWNLSRSRFWGIPLPLWTTEDGSEIRCISSAEELKNAADEAVAAGLMESNPIGSFVPGDMSQDNYESIDLHKNVVDKIVLLSPSGKPMKRESDLIDVWFDSGAMPYAQLHYPFENKELIDNGIAYPADFIAEGVDQTRGWFYTLHAIATLCFDSVAYKNVVSNGLVLDKFGQKMSKRLGNAVDPFKTLDQYGADATRWYMISNAQPWDNLKFDEEGIVEVQRKFFGTLFNTYNFFSMYANIDGFVYDAGNVTPLKDRPELDRWILSRLNSLKKEVQTKLNDFDPTPTARAMEYFVDRDLSNWFVRLSRKRYWKSEDAADQKAAYETLYECLVSMAQLMSPIAPFFAEWIWQNLTAPVRKAGKGDQFLNEESVHLTYFQAASDQVIDLELEAQMDLAQRACSLVLSLRKKEKLKVRQPLSRIMIPADDKQIIGRIQHVSELILSEVNVKAVEFIEDAAGIVTKKIKPNFKSLGARLGAKMKTAAAAISAMSQDEIFAFEKQKSWKLELEGEVIELEIGDVEILSEDIAGWTVANDDKLTIALDIAVTQELREEGLSREVVNRIQNLRKSSGLGVTDRINVSFNSFEEAVTSIIKHKSYICDQVLAEQLEFDGNLNQENSSETELDDLPLYLKINVKN